MTLDEFLIEKKKRIQKVIQQRNKDFKILFPRETPLYYPDSFEDWDDLFEGK